jgi:hypothetical protein
VVCDNIDYILSSQKSRNVLDSDEPRVEIEFFIPYKIVSIGCSFMTFIGRSFIEVVSRKRGIKGKSKFVCVHNVKIYKGSGGTAPHILNLGTGWG